MPAMSSPARKRPSASSGAALRQLNRPLSIVQSAMMAIWEIISTARPIWEKVNRKLYAPRSNSPRNATAMHSTALTIGTTVTALLACIGQGKNAARAALAHSCFNLSGSLLAAVLLPWFVRLVELISPKGPELEVISRQIANAHTAFNVCCALLWLPFLPWMVRLVCALVPEKEKK